MKKYYPLSIEIYIYVGEYGVMHLKEIFTEKFLFTGTSNFTFSGLNSNFETNWFFEDEGILVQERIEDFNKLINR